MLVNPVVLKEGRPMPPVGSVFVEDNAVVFFVGKELVDIVDASKLSVLNDFGIGAQDLLNVSVRKGLVD